MSVRWTGPPPEPADSVAVGEEELLTSYQEWVDYLQYEALNSEQIRRDVVSKVGAKDMVKILAGVAQLGNNPTSIKRQQKTKDKDRLRELLELLRKYQIDKNNHVTPAGLTPARVAGAFPVLNLIVRQLSEDKLPEPSVAFKGPKSINDLSLGALVILLPDMQTYLDNMAIVLAEAQEGRELTDAEAGSAMTRASTFRKAAIREFKTSHSQWTKGVAGYTVKDALAFYGFRV